MNKIIKNSISIVGGAGHVGFPLGLAFGSKKYKINLVDVDQKNLNKIKLGIPPFYEIGAKKLLHKCLKKKILSFSNDLKTVKTSKFIIICIGTPVNKKLKPEVKNFVALFYKLLKIINKNQILIIRSSVYPGMIRKISKILKTKNNNIVYCPERIVQSKALIELPNLPQVVAGVNKNSVHIVSKLFKKICKKILLSTIQEAELIKLFSNANRYINFAIANQLFIMCEKYNVDFDRIRKLMKFGYERNLNLPKSGFTAGPCLLKDTMQLSSFYKGRFELGFASMKINQSMVDLVIEKVENIKNSKKKIIGILGVTFKAETDDIRDSLSIDLIKKLKKRKFKVIYSDVYYRDKNYYKTNSLIKKSDIIIIGAPHKKYMNLKFSKNKHVIDIWGRSKE
tara:strand:+ start:1690 stop:2874 length:1185 start_codon:yes stop_codon:yes gene_type:complete